MLTMDKGEVSRLHKEYRAAKRFWIGLFDKDTPAPAEDQRLFDDEGHFASQFNTIAQMKRCVRSVKQREASLWKIYNRNVAQMDQSAEELRINFERG